MLTMRLEELLADRRLLAEMKVKCPRNRDEPLVGDGYRARLGAVVSRGYGATFALKD
jgi:hypothetical protein